MVESFVTSKLSQQTLIYFYVPFLFELISFNHLKWAREMNGEKGKQEAEEQI